MASLQARHSRSCALGKPWTPLSATDGCTCPKGPLYHVVVREGAKAHKSAVGRNLREAKRALAKVTVDVDDGGFRPVQAIKFSTFADEWIKRLERKETTRDSYRATMSLAKDAFGEKTVRQIRPADITDLNRTLRDEKSQSTSTRAKHLRVLHACLASAIAHGYATRNPVSDLPDSERPRATKSESAFFTNDEIPRLFAKIPERIADVPNVYRPLFLTALKTGMRQGELLALTWADVDLLGGVIHVRRSITDGHVSTPKNHEKREVHLAEDVVKMLGTWNITSGRPPESALVFAGTTGKHLWPMTILRRELYPAMVAAEIDRVGPTGAKRTFHSFRHTYAKRALENGRQITWLSKHLGHSSLKVTTDVYGHWETAEKKAQAEQMAGVFGV
jgi:integrase